VSDRERWRRYYTPIDGYTESAWKSLVVKAVRLGWPEGLRQAELRLSPSKVKGVLLTQVFEDIWPTEDELEDTLGELKRGEWHGLCERDTLHGRGYIEVYLDPKLGAESEEAARAPGTFGLYDEARKRKLYLPDRAWSNFAHWLKVAPADSGQRRTLDMHPWRGMPAAILDAHTVEGRQRGTRTTILSGSLEGHRMLAEAVMKDGWDAVRELVHGDIDRPPKKKRPPTPAEKAIARNERRRQKKRPPDTEAAAALEHARRAQRRIPGMEDG
jgi:hypothetical protein